MRECDNYKEKSNHSVSNKKRYNNDGGEKEEKERRNSPRSVRQVRRSRDRPPEIFRVSTSAEASN